MIREVFLSQEPADLCAWDACSHHLAQLPKHSGVYILLSLVPMLKIAMIKKRALYMYLKGVDVVQGNVVEW